MVYLVDTNVLLRLCDRQHPLHPTIRAAIRQLQARGDQLQMTPQNCVEFWNVATRPLIRNGFGLTLDKANRLLRLLERLFPILPEVSTVYTCWRRLVMDFGVMGVQVHDARLVAIMQAHGLTHILTFNTDDFKRYASEGIQAINPNDI
jgi:predicted nucleic acid-binding protein